MAEETINNAENLDSQPSAFDQLLAKSEFLNPARVEQSLAPKVEWKDNFVNPTNYIKDNTAGVSPNFPPSQVRSAQMNGATTGAFDAVLNAGMAKINNSSDLGAYAEPYAYDASPKGTFRERYKAYGQETFNKVGFHPLIDNETWFNQNTTFGDDLSRWATHAAWPMLSKGFMDPIRSYKSMLDGNGLFDADPQSARDYEYYNAIGASTKGGAGQFAVNLLNSASYSMGILLEGAVEGTLIGATFGGGNAATGALEGGAAFANKMGSLPRALIDASKGTAKLFSSVKNYSNLAKAKELFKSAGSNFGNFLNPLHNSAAAYRQLKNTDNITNLARSAVTAGALWHDMMAMNMALSEGKLEGGFTRYQTYDRLYNEHYQAKGKPPTLEEQESMMRQASKGAFWNTLNNTALIYYTNKIVFPSITNASFLTGVPKFNFGKVVTNVGKEFQVIFDPGKKALEGAFSKQRISLVNAIKSLAKPRTYGKVGLNYFKANVMEGVQEVAQDVLQEATQDYYVQTYKNPDARNFRYGAGLVGDAISKQWSAQGLETFLSGMLMGTILQAPGTMKKYATIGFNDYFKKDPSYRQYIEGREELADTVVNELNTMYKNGQFFFDPRINNYANQALVANVVDNPDEHTTKEIRDAEFTAFQSAVLSSLQNGTFDMFLKHYEGYKQATPEDIEQAWNLAPGQGEKALERFDKSLENAKKIRDRWNEAKDKMQFMANLDDYEKDSEEYRIAEIYNKAYNQSLYNYIFLHNSYDDNVKRLKSIYGDLSSLSVLRNSNFADFVGFTDPNRLTKEIEMLKTEVENLQQFGSAEALGEATRKRELIETYTKFQEKQENLVDLFVNKTFLDNIKNEILNEDPDLTDNQATVKAINKVVEQYDKGESVEFLDYKEAFSELLFSLAGDNESRMQLQSELQNMKGGIDDLFDKLLDTHILKNENSRLIEYVNLLANPREFYEHLMRNFKFMKDLYYNREEIVKDIVNKEIESIENNTLLNTLADQGIYIDLEEFAKWVEDKRYLPEQFIDVTNNRIINKGSVLYQDLIGIFLKAAQIAEKKPAGDPLTQKQILDKRISTLEQDRQAALDKEKQKYDQEFLDIYGMTEEEYRAQEASRIASEELTAEEREALEKEKAVIVKAIDKLQSDNYVEVLAAADVMSEVLASQGENPQQYFDEQTEIHKNDPQKKQIIFNLAQKFDTSDIDDQQEAIDTKVSAALNSQIYGQFATARLAQIEEELNKQPAAPTIDVENSREYLAYQEAVQQINDRYDALISEVKEDFREKGIDENTPDQYTTKTEFQDFDGVFQNEITDLFDKYLVDVLLESLDIKTKNPVEYERLRANWLERQSDLIERFNEEAKQSALEKARRLAQPPQLKFIDLQINNQTTAYTISSLIKKFEKFLKDGEYPDPDNSNTKIQLTPEDIQNIKDDIEAMNGYLSARVSAAEPRNIAEETMSIIQENIIDKQDEVVEVFDEDGNMIGRTFRDRGPNDPRPDRTTQVAEEVENSVKGKDSFEYSPIKPTVDKDGNVLPSPVQRLYEQFFEDPEIVEEDRIRLFMDAFKREVYRGWKEFKYPEKLEAVENSLKTVGTYEHLKNTIDKYAFKESSDAGDYIDALIRIFLTPNAATNSKFSEFTYDSTFQSKGRDIKISDIMSRKAFDKLFAPVTPTKPGGMITKFRLGIVDGTYMILSENVKLFDKNLRDGRGVTGEVDLLLLREDGSVAIVDIKTKKKKERNGKVISGWKDFGDPEAKYESSVYFRAQQSIYGYQFYNSTGITPDLKLMPFDMTLSKDKIGYIEDIDLAEIVAPGDDTIDLEYLPEIENFGIVKITPEIKVPTKQETKAKEESKSDGIPESDPKMNKLDDNLNKAVVYNGRVGKLVRTSDGNFAIEVTINNDITALQLTLDALEANLDVEKEYGSEETIKELEDNIKKISSAIDSAKGVTELFPLQNNATNVSDGTITLDKVGLQLVVPVESFGQLSTINNEVINASFSNKDESIANINGVKYNVLRDSSGNITALSYMTNDEMISQLDKQVGDLANKVGELRKALNETTEKDAIITRIGQLQNQITQLSAKRKSLFDSNKKLYIYGENANNYIFALNRLPNNFQRLTKDATAAQETQDLKSISSLSLSSSIADTITEILAEGYPEELDQLFDGTFDYKFKAKPKINKWIDTSIEKLNNLGYTVINRGDLVDDIQNQINALLDLKNDLTLIKLTRERKIKNYAEVRKIFTEGQRVQEGTSVPKNEGTTRRSTKGVSRPATREELQELVKAAREEELGEIFDESVVSEEETTEAVSNINNATLENIEEIYQKEFLDAVKNDQDMTQLREAYLTRLQELKTIVSIANVGVNEYLISKNPIFTDISNEVVVVVKKTRKGVTLKNIKTDETKTFNEAELVENFEKTTMEATQPEPEVKLTPVDIEDSNESKDVIKGIQDDPTAIPNSKAKAKASDKKSRWDKLADNSKLC